MTFLLFQTRLCHLTIFLFNFLFEMNFLLILFFNLSHLLQFLYISVFVSKLCKAKKSFWSVLEFHLDFFSLIKTWRDDVKLWTLINSFFTPLPIAYVWLCVYIKNKWNKNEKEDIILFSALFPVGCCNNNIIVWLDSSVAGFWLLLQCVVVVVCLVF